ncbi:HPr family phosphocarrier protein [Fusibacter sp. JL298sf-3]
MKSIEVTVQSGTGLHARPASLLVAEATKYESDITVNREGASANAKSIFGILSLSASTGDTITVIAEGNDETQAIEGIQKLFDEGL